MAHYFTAKEQNEFYNKQPAKRTGSPVLIFNDKGELLLVKPSYKSGWSLVGGVCEKDESLLTSAIREIREEIGIKLTSADFIFSGLRYVAAQDGRTDELQPYFKVLLSKEQAQSITIPSDEIEAFRFVPLAELSDYADTPRIQAVIAAMPAIVKNEPFYLENETRIV